ncbi:MAG: Tfp pilus assembly protein FimT/FimU [Bradymonadaceae bacterium]
MTFRSKLGSEQYLPGGFTLVELMVTLALVAILAAVAAPSFNDYLRQADGRSAARTVANEFRTARDQAMSRGEVVFAKVIHSASGSGSRGRVELRRTNDGATSCMAAEAKDSDTTVVRTVDVASQSSYVQIQGSSTGTTPQWVCFSPSGEALDGGGGEFGSCSGHSYRLYLGESFSDSKLGECDPNNWSRTELRDKRYLENVWIVDMPYNGGVEAIQ